MKDQRWIRHAAGAVAALLFALALQFSLAGQAQAQDMTQVTVQRGDTLSKIAARNCTTWQEIYNLNRAAVGANPSVIRVGTVLTVPNRCGGMPGDGNTGGVWDRGLRLHATGSFNAPWYTVARGDTLTSIAQRFGVTLRILRAQNNIAGSNISTGQLLLIGGGGAEPLPPPVDPNQPVTERVRFDPYAISASRSGVIQGATPIVYLLNVQRGQTMTVYTQSFGPPLQITLTSPTGQPIGLTGRNAELTNSVSALLPASGDTAVLISPIPDGIGRSSFNFNITFVVQ